MAEEQGKKDKGAYAAGLTPSLPSVTEFASFVMGPGGQVVRGSQPGSTGQMQTLPNIVRDFQGFYTGMPDPNAGYREGLGRVRDERLADLDNRLLALDDIYQQDRQSIASMFNTSEDPNAARIRDWALQELDNQAMAAAEAITASYGTAQEQQAASAAEARAIGEEISARNAALYEQAAGNVAAANASLAGMAGGPMGSAPVTGEAIDTLGVLAAAAPREAALAATLGDIAAQRELAFQQSLAGQEVAQQGALQRAAMTNRSDIIGESARREAERIAREREALRAAEIALLGNFRDQQSSLMDQRSTALSEFGMADLEAGRDSAMLDWELERDLRDAALSLQLQQEETGGNAPITYSPDLQQLYFEAKDKEKAGNAVSAIAIARSFPTQAEQAAQLLESWNANKDAFNAIGVTDVTQLFSVAGLSPSWTPANGGSVVGVVAPPPAQSTSRGANIFTPQGQQDLLDNIWLGDTPRTS